ncbi:MAG: TatD family hydrolase [bacterium]|nr:TatD family hydrolase [bacterium]
MLIDTHAHLNFEAFNADWKEKIGRCFNEDVAVINVGSDYNTSKKAIEIAGFFDGKVYAAVGTHPIHAKEGFDAARFKELAESSKVVAIGEIGLDKFKEYGLFFEDQKKIFKEQLNLAKELDLPVIIHCRMAHSELIEMLSGFKIRGVLHCFTGTWEDAQKYLNMGLYLGINGIMYRFDLKEVIEKTPLDKLLLETDSPYLGLNKEERNEPVFVKQIAKDIARIKGISFEDVAEITTLNAQTLFSI